jgi:uncharacterized DUF497 family protein
VFIGELQWEDKDINHIALHNVTPQEIEDVCFGLHLSKKERGQRYILSGQADNGRYINVIIQRIGGSIFRPKTAFEMSEKYKKRYKKRFGK